TPNAVRHLVARGHLKVGVHFLQPTGRGGFVRFRWSRIEAWLNSTPLPERKQQLSKEQIRDHIDQRADALFSGTSVPPIPSGLPLPERKAPSTSLVQQRGGGVQGRKSDHRRPRTR